MDTANYLSLDAAAMAQKPKSTSSSIFRLVVVLTAIMAVLKLFTIPLTNSGFIFIYIPAMLLGYASMFILFICSIIYWFKQEHTARRPFLPLVLSLLTSSFIVFFPFTDVALRINFLQYQQDREKVVAMITTKELPYDLASSSSVVIPAQYANLSAGSPQVTVEMIGGKAHVLFYTFRGLTDNASGFVYVPDESIISKIKINQFNSSSIFYHPIQLKKLTSHWYFVSNT